MEIYNTTEILEKLNKSQVDQTLPVDTYSLYEEKIGLEEEALLNYKILSDRSVFKNELKVFYSRYFWLLIYVEKQKALHGPDVGLEQQLFKLLEESETLSEEVDWSFVENLEKKVRS